VKADKETRALILKELKEMVDKHFKQVKHTCLISIDYISYDFTFDSNYNFSLFVCYQGDTEIQVSVGGRHVFVEICDPECFRKVDVAVGELMRKFVESENAGFQSLIDWRLGIIQALNREVDDEDIRTDMVG